MPKMIVYRGRERLFESEITRAVTMIGRSRGADIPLDSEAVSRNHLRIVQNGETFVAEDLGTPNGFFYNGRRVERAELKHGDRLEIAQHFLVWHHDRTADAAAAENEKNPYHYKDQDVKRFLGGGKEKEQDPRKVAASLDGMKKTAMVSAEMMARLRAGLAVRRRAHLAFVVDGKSENVPLDDEFLVIGWDADTCDIYLPGTAWFWKTAAEIEPVTGKRGRYILRALSRFRPVYLNGKRVTSHALKDGDTFNIGSVRFRFRGIMS